MNGNFEHDKSSYPYSVLRQGDGAYLAHTPSLKKLADLNLPVAVIGLAALELNVAYWGTPKKDITPLLKNVKALLLRAAREAYTERSISGPSYDQIKGQIEGLAD